MIRMPNTSPSAQQVKSNISVNDSGGPDGAAFVEAGVGGMAVGVAA